MTQQSPPIRGEPIPGYRIVERLGSGGYGEVWKAMAPGGLEKAVKIVHGDYDDARAERELKALNRVKEVRHPFLLSLDRIEIVDGQLVIVTELADMSLKDRFTDCRREGADGIARDELLGYLHDAADALDYMSQRWSLQHLDVKPENLLLVGERVKVADFGLVQNIQNVSVSLLGGLTPISPPELFEGRPGLRSDQYSLAIVYQEMLTGVLPFAGTSAAQLMTHHLRDRPQLSSLPAADRADIARALSKRPTDRFPSCCAMVDALRGRRSTAPRRAAVARPRPSQGDAQSEADAARGHTCAGSSGDAAEPPALVAKTSPIPTSTISFENATVDTAPQAVELPPIELDSTDTEYGPSLFLAIGGTAAMTIRHLRERIGDQVGPMSQIPAFQTLLMDTDLREIVRATQGDDAAALLASETIAMPLRNPHQYRAGTDKFLGWLSRRWLYNIPRSLQPDGRRPLGRLALVDHAEHVFERIRETLETCTSQEALEASSAATGRPFSPCRPRVYLIASLAGGTGSGMIVDMAYAVRSLLNDIGLSDDGVCGILMHSASRDADARDLAIANTCACLSEIYHFSHPSLSYPGAPECGIGPRGEDDLTFPNAYFIDLGDRLSNNALDAATEDVAEYLYRDASTPVGQWLDQSRTASPSDADHAAGHWLRSFGVCRLGNYDSSLAARLTDRLCRDVVSQWCHGETGGVAPSTNQAASAAETPAEPAHADANRAPTAQQDLFGCNEGKLREQVTDAVSGQFQRDHLPSLQSHIDSLLGTVKRNAASQVDATQLISSIDQWLEQPAAPPSFAADTAPPDRLQHDVDQITQRHAEDIRESLQRLLNAPQPRTTVAVRIATRLASQLKAIDARSTADYSSMQQRVRQASEDIIASFEDSERPRWRILTGHSHNRQVTTTAGLLERYATLRINEVVAKQLCRVVQQLRRTVADELRRLSELQSELNSLARNLSKGVAPGAVQHNCGDSQVAIAGAMSSADTLQVNPPIMTQRRNGDSVRQRGQNGMDAAVTKYVLGILEQRWPDLVDQFETEIVRDVLGPHGGLAAAMAPRSTFRPNAATTLRSTALTLVIHCFQEINIADFLFRNILGNGQDAFEQFQLWVQAAVPRAAVGGGKRLLLAVREETDVHAANEIIAKVTGQPSTVVPGTDVDLLFCYEAEQIPLAGVFSHLVGQSTHYTEIASRLHTRVDVPWTPIALA